MAVVQKKNEQMKPISSNEENPNAAILTEPYEKFERKIIRHLPEIDYLQFGECIGRGTFSHVYKGIYHQKDQVAIKLIDRGSDYLIKNEIDILTKLKGVPHVVQLYEVIFCDQFENEESCNNNIDNDQDKKIPINSLNNHDNESIQIEKVPITNQNLHLKPSSFSKLALLVFEYLDGNDCKSLYQNFSINQIRILLRSILEALSAAHNLGIIHRDVKLSNIIVLPNFSDVKLIDWGCATFINEYMSSKSGSREYRPPEMLLGYQNYGRECDVWAVGIIILFILTGGIIPWKARTSGLTLIKMSEYIGGDCIKEYAKKLNLEIDPDICDQFYDQPQCSIESEFNESKSKDLLKDDLIELMKSCLTVDYKLRPTAKELLEYSFFKQ